jgi:AraC-like DNA-binding protein/quercetin dioxygenase-like cupin family protein
MIERSSIPTIHPRENNQMLERLHIPQHLDGRLWFYSRSPIHPVHRHSELEANLVTRGSARYIVDDHRYDLLPGTLLFLFPAQEHVLIDISADFQMYIAVWRPRLLKAACKSSATRPLKKRRPNVPAIRHLSAPDSRSLAALYERINAIPEESSDHLNAALAHVLLASWETFNATTDAAAARIHPAVEQAALLLKSDPTLSLPALADKAALSPARLSRLFHQHTKIPLVRFRQQLLLDRFLQLHADHPQLKLLTLALRAGFGSYPQFHRVFRQLTAQNPATYLRKTEPKTQRKTEPVA